MKPLTILPVLAVLALTACGTPPHRSLVVTPQEMNCSGNRAASLTLHSHDDAVLMFEGKSYDLKHVPTASGAKYYSKRISIWNKGISAMILGPGDKVLATCDHLPKKGL